MSEETKECPLGIVDVAHDLTNQLIAYEIPPDFVPADLYYAEILANVRHEFTNYEELLGVMDERANCLEYLMHGGSCPNDREGEECDQHRYAHDILKWAAKDIAAGAYEEWLEARKRERPS